MVTLLCRQIQDIGGRIAMLVTFQCEQSIINILSRLPTSKRCHHYRLSPTSVINVVLLSLRVTF